MSYEPATVPCETCGTPTLYLGTQRCNNCYEVESRLDHYMRSPKALEVIRKHSPAIDDWVDGHPDAWDYEAVLREHNVEVQWSDTVVDGEGNEYPAPEFAGWSFGWKHGAIHIGQTTETIARKAAAMFVSLWLRGVSASFCDKIMSGYIVFLELACTQHAGGMLRHEGLVVEGSAKHSVERPLWRPDEGGGQIAQPSLAFLQTMSRVQF